ncbi:MAG TPA: deazaflavin-dependent nitroreductase [Acidimicrobiia bacterium]|nr:deazaflavin-dependent nitroreductase [Acidimicrobiia bacterium]
MTKNQAHSKPATGKLPSWLPMANRVVTWLQRRGLKTGTIHILTVPGRASGELRTTPVSILTVGGVRHVVGGVDSADWVQNVRAVGWGHLAYGRNEEKVSLIELGVEDRGPILRVFPTEVPHGTQFFERVHGIKPTPDEFASLADRCPVFRVESFTES